jgi:DNA-nicking Smr family endonuclease
VPSIKQWRRNSEYVPEELDLHGLTVDEALPKLDEFIHTAFRAGYYQVRIVHGKGSGILRREVGLYLSNHPLVRSHRLADKYHGGDGATQVELSDR